MARKSNNKQTAVEADIETNNEEATAHGMCVSSSLGIYIYHQSHNPILAKQ